jgi:hypothetical protein
MRLGLELNQYRPKGSSALAGESGIFSSCVGAGVPLLEGEAPRDSDAVWLRVCVREEIALPETLAAVEDLPDAPGDVAAATADGGAVEAATLNGERVVLPERAPDGDVVGSATAAAGVEVAAASEAAGEDAPAATETAGEGPDVRALTEGMPLPIAPPATAGLAAGGATLPEAAGLGVPTALALNDGFGRADAPVKLPPLAKSTVEEAPPSPAAMAAPAEFTRDDLEPKTAPTITTNSTTTATPAPRKRYRRHADCWSRPALLVFGSGLEGRMRTWCEAEIDREANGFSVASTIPPHHRYRGRPGQRRH